MNTVRQELTERQREILRRVVEDYVATGQPVGSKAFVERFGMNISASTVRNEFSELEALGLLTHPHTSAGRVPTERGYRFFAEGLLQALDPRPGPFPLDLTTARTEVDSALEATTEMLSEVTRLLALVSAPPLGSTSIRHVEVLLLQPQVVMVVVITSTGGVTKRAYSFAEPVDPGLANWAAEYLNESIAGTPLGVNLLRRCFEDPALARREAAFLAALRASFAELVHGEGEGERLFIGGAAGLLEDASTDELAGYRRLLELLEKRAALLAIVKQTLDPRRPFVRVGDELDHPALHDLALVGASYGLATRTLGAVSLLGPVRMDYDKAIRSVRAAAHELSRFVEEIYEEN